MYLRAGESLWQGGRYARADEMLLKAIAKFERVAPASVYEELAVAQAQNLRGRVASYAGQFDQASGLFLHGTEHPASCREQSLAVAETLHTLGNTAFWQGDIDSAEQYFLNALEIRELLAPGSVDHGRSMATLGNVAWRRGALDAAEQYFVNAYEIHSCRTAGQSVGGWSPDDARARCLKHEEFPQGGKLLFSIAGLLPKSSSRTTRQFRTR